MTNIYSNKTIIKFHYKKLTIHDTDNVSNQAVIEEKSTQKISKKLLNFVILMFNELLNKRVY